MTPLLGAGSLLVPTIRNIIFTWLYLHHPTRLSHWKGVQTPFQSPDFGFRMGVDKNGFYACWWNYQYVTGNTHIMMDGCAIPKADILAPGGPDLTHMSKFTNFEVESFPATDLDPNRSLTDPEVFLNKQFRTDTATGPITQLCMYKISWSNTNSASMSPV